MCVQERECVWVCEIGKCVCVCVCVQESECVWVCEIVKV